MLCKSAARSRLKLRRCCCWQDGQLTRRVSTAKIAEFLALYYNAAAGWGKGREGVCTYKDDALIKSSGPHAASAVKDLERGGAKTTLAAPWQTDDSMDPNTWSWAEPPILKNSTQLICELVDIVRCVSQRARRRPAVHTFPG